MTDDSDLHVVLGASGGIGGAVLAQLAAEGRRVRAVARSPFAAPAGVETLQVDVSTQEGAAAACAGAAVVIHCAQPAYGRWAEDFPALNEAVLGAAGAVGARLVFADNLYMYAPTDTITEATPEAPVSRKGRVRKQLADRLLAAHAAGDVRVAIGRATDYVGKDAAGSTPGAMLADLRAGKAGRWPGRIDVAHAIAALPDVARGMVTLADHQAADGRAWIFPTAPATTAAELARIAGDVLGHPTSVRATGKFTMRIAGVLIPEARELPDIWHQYDRPWLVDGSAFDAAFGPLQPIDLRDVVAAALT